MKRFAVEVARKVVLTATLEVEAQTKYEAQSKVSQRLANDLEGINQDLRNTGWDTTPLVTEDAKYDEVRVVSVKEIA